MSGLSQVPYEEIVKELHEFGSYLSSLGLSGSSDRLRLLTRHCEQIMEAHDQGRLEQLMERDDLEDLVWSLVEASEFSRIYRGLHTYDPTVIKELFRKALRGPLHPGKETAHKSNLGRNTAFELRLGSGLVQAGAKVTLGGRADLRVDHSGARVYIECKRPFYERSIRANILEAREQLQNRLNGDQHPLAAGIVAISVSKALNPGSRLFVVETERELQDLALDIARLHQGNYWDFDKLPDLRLLGIIYHLFTPAYIRSIPLLTAATQSVVIFSGPAVQTMFPVSLGQPLKEVLRLALSGS